MRRYSCVRDPPKKPPVGNLRKRAIAFLSARMRTKVPQREYRRRLVIVQKNHNRKMDRIFGDSAHAVDTIEQARDVLASREQDRYAKELAYFKKIHGR